MSGEFKIEDGTSVSEAVGTALGYASMCWIGGTGDAEFDSVRAAQCARELTDAIVNGRLRVEGTGLAPQPSRWQPLGPDGRPLPGGDTSLRAPDGAPWSAHADGPCGPECGHAPDGGNHPIVAQ